MGEACVRPGCSGGVIDADGYCTECGLTAVVAAVAVGPTGSFGTNRCTRPGCSGTIDTDGYCDECGLAAEAAASAPVSVPSARHAPDSARSSRTGSARTGSARSMSGRSRSHRSTRTGTRGSVSVRSSKGTRAPASAHGSAPAW